MNNLLKISNDIYEKSELVILNINSKGKLPLYLIKLLILPFKLLNIGWVDFIRPVITWAFITFIILILIVLMLESGSIPTSILILYSSSGLLCSFFIILFSVPSSFAYSGIENNKLELIGEIIRNKNINNHESIDLIIDNIEDIKNRALNRISAYKYLLGFFWTIFLFTTGIFINAKLKQDINEVNLILMNLLQDISYAIVILTTVSILLACYTRGINIIMQHIKLALTDTKYHLINSQQP